MVRGENLNFGRNVEGLGDIADSADAYQAVGRWWAHALLEGVFDNGTYDSSFDRAVEGSRRELFGAMGEIKSVIGKFAEEVEFASRECGVNTVTCDYHPCDTLAFAAEDAGMPETQVEIFPWKSRTVINHDGSVSAKMGIADPLTKIWPPELADPNLS